MSSIGLFFVIGSLFFFPPIAVGFISRSLSINMGIIIVVLLLLYYLIKEPSMMNYTLSRFINNNSVIIILICCMMIAIWFGLLFALLQLDYRFSKRDVFTLGYYIIYIMFLFYGFSIGYNGFCSKHRMLKLFLFWGIITISFSICIYFYQPSFLMKMIEKIWGDQLFLTKRLYLYQQQAYWRPLIGLFGNNNYFSIYLTIIFCFFFFFKSKYLVLYLPIFTFLILFANSKAGLIIFIISLLIILFYSRKYGTKKLCAIILIFAGLIGFFIISASMFSSFNIVFFINKLILELGEYKRSLVARFEIWETFLYYFRMSPLVGAGPLKSNLRFMGDSTYILTAGTSGLFGVAFFMGLKLYLIIKSCKLNYAAYKANDRETIVLSSISILLAVILLIFDLTSDYFYYLPCMTYSFLFWGFTFGISARKSMNISRME